MLPLGMLGWRRKTQVVRFSRVHHTVYQAKPTPLLLLLLLVLLLLLQIHGSGSKSRERPVPPVAKVLLVKDRRDVGDVAKKAHGVGVDSVPEGSAGRDKRREGRLLRRERPVLASSLYQDSRIGAEECGVDGLRPTQRRRAGRNHSLYLARTKKGRREEQAGRQALDCDTTIQEE